MRELIDFFVEIGKLKNVRRRGWLMRDVKNPETVAEHAYRVLFLAWIFSKGHRLNTKKILKMALIHSLSAVQIDYISPYDKLLEAKSHSEAQRRYPALVIRAPVQTKELIKSKRFKEERRVVKRLIKDLPEHFSGEILDLWQDFQTSSSKESKFLRAIDKVENLIQAIEYQSQMQKKFIAPFWAQIFEVTDDPKLISFIDGLDQYFREGKAKKRSTQKMIEFIKLVGQMKRIKRKGWVLRGVKNPESLAEHSFRAAFIAWVLSGRKRIDREIILVMLFIHDLFASLIGDITPYDKIVDGTKDKKRILDTLPWLGSSKGKHVLALEYLEKEAKALDRVLSLLPQNLRREIKYLWLEYKTGTSKEARFARQADRIESVIQAMEYARKDKSIPVKAFWLELKELIDDPLLADFVEQLDYHFLQQRK